MQMKEQLSVAVWKIKDTDSSYTIYFGGVHTVDLFRNFTTWNKSTLRQQKTAVICRIAE